MQLLLEDLIRVLIRFIRSRSMRFSLLLNAIRVVRPMAAGKVASINSNRSARSFSRTLRSSLRFRAVSPLSFSRPFTVAFTYFLRSSGLFSFLTSVRKKMPLQLSLGHFGSIFSESKWLTSDTKQSGQQSAMQPGSEHWSDVWVMGMKHTMHSGAGADMLVDRSVS